VSVKDIQRLSILNINNLYKTLVCGLILLISRDFLWSTGSEIKMTERWLNAATWQWQAELPVPKVTINNEIRASVIEISGLDNSVRGGFPSIPVYRKLFNALPDEITYQVQSGGQSYMQLSALVEIFWDTPVTGNDSPSIATPPDESKSFSTYPMRLVEIDFIGYVKGVPLSCVSIYPYQLLDNGRQIKCFSTVTVQVAIKPGNRLQKNVSQSDESLLKALDIRSGEVRRLVKPHTPLAKTASIFPAGKILARFTVDEDGIYRISCKTLSDSGVVLKNVDPRTFRLYNQHKEVPIYLNGESDGVFNRGDYIEFFGRRNRNSVADYEYDPFSDKNVYWLTWGENYGLRYAEESVQVNSPIDETIVPIDYLFTAHIEVNDAFHRLGQVDIDKPTYVRDHWFFDEGIYGGTTRQYTFQLSYPNPNNIKDFSAELTLHGLTYDNAGIHEVKYFINSVEVASGKWKNQMAYSVKSSPVNNLPNRYLLNGQNILQIDVADIDLNKIPNALVADYLKIKYYRLYKADSDEIEFTRPAGNLNYNYTFTLTNFSSPDISIYKVGRSKLRDFTTEYNKSTNSYKVVLQDYVRDDTTLYWAACDEALKKPISVRLDTIMGLSSSTSGANIIIITRQEWINSLAKLTDFYAASGMSSQVVGIKDIYNEFSAGIVTPFAVKRFLQYVSNNWNPAPEYVLLIGDANLKEEQSVPAFFFQTYGFGACPGDFWYALVDDDEVPDFAIGRWPCSTDDGLELLIDKRINYTKSNMIGSWNNELLFIAGKEDVFKNQSENMIQRQIGKEFNINRIYINPASIGSPFFGGSDTLLYLFNNGITLGNFMGHGGGAVWADRGLFNSDHIKDMTNYERLPFLTSMTCFTGDFTNVTGLGEMLLLAENGGAIGLWGASTFGWIKNDYLLAKPFYDVIFEPGMTVGKAIQTAKIRYQATAFDYLRLSMIYTYNLIGDPTVSLPFPDQSVRLELDKINPAPGESVTLAGTLPYETGKVYLQLFDSSKYAIFPEPQEIAFNSSNFSHVITLPVEINPGSTYINYYVESGTGKQDAHGVTLFDIGDLTFYGFGYSPSSPGRNEPVILSVFIELSDIESIFCEIDTVSADENLDEDGIEHIVSFQDDSALLSIPLTAVASIANKWQTAQPFQVGTPGKLIAVRFVVLDSNGGRTVSQPYAIKIRRAPDLYPVKIDQGGEKFPELIVSVYNNNDDALMAEVRAEHLIGQDSELFGSREVLLYPNRMTLVRFPGILGRDTAYYKISIDPDNEIAESNESNNILTHSVIVNTFAILPQLGTTYDGIQSDTILVAGIFKIAIAPLSVADSAVLILQTDTNLTVANQPKFSLISPSSEYSMLGLKVANGSASNSLALEISLKIDVTSLLSDQLTDLRIGKWNNSLRIWYQEESVIEGQTIKTLTTLPGTFSLIKNSDTTPPTLELNLEGQQFFQNSFVSDRPSISIIGEDDNGVRFDAEGIKVILDEDEIAFENLSAPDTITSGHYFSAQFRPTLEPGDHTLKVSLKDAAGNGTFQSVGFIVSDELKLIDYGNYPNPFKSQTTFIYELTQRVNTFKIKIYTTSGRLVRVLDSNNVFESGTDLNEGGYHEVMWDGLDGDGNFIANGIYFYKITAKSGDKTVTRIGKLAKAR